MTGGTNLQERFTAWADIVLSTLAVLMLVLLVVELGELAPPGYGDEIALAQTIIWMLFVASFVVELAIATSKTRYLRENWLVALSLALPLLRVFRVVRAVRLLRATRSVRVFTLGRLAASLNRARSALASFARASRFGYLLGLTLLVVSGVAAGAYYLERGAENTPIRSPYDAMWWAVTLVTTVNSSIEVVSAEARVLSIFLRLFGVAVIGYLTARFAVFLLGDEHPAANDATRTADDLMALREEIRALRLELAKNAERREDTPRRSSD